MEISVKYWAFMKSRVVHGQQIAAKKEAEHTGKRNTVAALEFLLCPIEGFIAVHGWALHSAT